MNICEGFHGINSCGYNSAFSKNDKKRPFNLLLQNPEYQGQLNKMSEYGLSRNEI